MVEKNLPAMIKFFFLLWGITFQSFCIGQKKQLSIPVIFEVVATNEKDILNKELLNDFDEKYTITKLKYYVSNLHFVTGETKNIKKSVHLIDASKKNIFSVVLPSKKITGISFLLGVDSLLNCSGAQSGALDPLNDMFWTWNNGYIFFKIDGNAETSTADLNRIEHHIGGFKGSNKTMREIYLPIEDMAFLKKSKLIIQLNIDKYWNGKNKLRFSESPIIASPGLLAKNASDNFMEMFLIKK